MTNNFYEDTGSSWVNVEPSIRRKISGCTSHLPVAVVCFQQGAIGTVRGPTDYEQIAYVPTGPFEVAIGGEKRILRTDDAFIAHKNVVHGVVALEPDNQILDLFSPRRDDFIED